MATAKGSKASLLVLQAAHLWRGLTAGRIAATLLSILLVYKTSSWLHAESYVWQSTALAGALRPVQRRSCPVPQPAASSSAAAADPRIGVVMIYDEAFDTDPEATRLVLANRKSYCERHKYTMIVARGADVDGSRPAAWSKLKIVLKHLPRFDYVFYMDMDVVVTNPLFSLAGVARAFPAADVIMTNDWSGPNTGMWLARNTPWTAQLLKLAWDATAPLVPKINAATGRKHPFEYEQRAFHWLLDTDVWRRRGLPGYKPPADLAGPVDGDFSSSSKIREHFAFVPQCVFNSYSLHPFDSRLVTGAASVEQSQWVAGDFVVHFAGKKGRAKTDLIRHYVSLADTGGGLAGAGARPALLRRQRS